MTKLHCSFITQKLRKKFYPYLNSHNSIAPPMHHLVNSSKRSSSYFTQVLEVI
jgi:hypothetical protein